MPIVRLGGSVRIAVESDKVYKDRVDKSDKRWLDTEIDEVFDGIVKYLNGFLQNP